MASSPVDLTPSPRKHGAQRMFSSTTLTVEAFVVFFAGLVAHPLVADQRAVTWTFALLTAALLLLSAGLLRRGAIGYWLGVLAQLPMILMGIWVPLMWVLGPGFAVLYGYGVVTGRRLDREKDEIDARAIAENPELAGDEDDRPGR
ncbi:MAG: DUF4233 domain-containing protein [Brachybacterium sp.]|nr:DUF4233 domain-containing protein [Brachybacterium sp.]